MTKSNRSWSTTTGSRRRDYTYIDDVLDGILAVLVRPSPFQLDNLGNSRIFVLLDLVHLIEEAFHKKAHIRVKPVQPGDAPLIFGEIYRAREGLAYSSTTSIVDGIPRFVKWYLRNKVVD